MQIACNRRGLHAIFVESGGRKFVGWEISCNFVALIAGDAAKWI